MGKKEEELIGDVELLKRAQIGKNVGIIK